MSYQGDQALFDSCKVPHQVVAVVTDTVWALELASSFTNKCLFTNIKGQHDEINLRPSRKCTQLSISSLQMTTSRLCISMLCCDDTLRLDLQIIVRDMHVKWYYDSCCTQSFKNNPMPGYISIYRSPKRSYIERMVLYFSRFLLLDPKYLCFNGAKNCHI